MAGETAERTSQAALWDHYQNEGRASFEGSRTRLAHLAGLVVRFAGRGACVLDVGVGGGIFEEIARGRGLDVHALDPSERAIAELRDRLALGERARVGTLAAIPFDRESFDALVCSEVFEHLAEPELARALMEIERVLRPRGVLVGTVPAREDLAAHQVVCPHCERHFHRWGHVQAFERAGLMRVLERSFELVHLDERPFPNWPTLNWKGRLRGLAKRTLARLGQHGSDESLVFVARRR